MENKETVNKLAISALSAFIGAFLGSYFIIHQFLLREYPAMHPIMKHCPFRQTEGKMNPFEENFSFERKKGRKFKQYKEEDQGTVYVIMGGKDLKDMPFDIDEIHKRIIQIK